MMFLKWSIVLPALLLSVLVQAQDSKGLPPLKSDIVLVRVVESAGGWSPMVVVTDGGEEVFTQNLEAFGRRNWSDNLKVVAQVLNDVLGMGYELKHTYSSVFGEAGGDLTRSPAQMLTDYLFQRKK